jgi:hypothetical protein
LLLLLLLLRLLLRLLLPLLLAWLHVGGVRHCHLCLLLLGGALGAAHAA